MTAKTQLTRGLKRRLMYVENKDGDIDGADARIGYVAFSKTGQSIYYRGLTLTKNNGVAGNFVDAQTGEEYWVSGVKKRGSNTHWAEGGVYAVSASVIPGPTKSEPGIQESRAAFESWLAACGRAGFRARATRAPE